MADIFRKTKKTEEDNPKISANKYEYIFGRKPGDPEWFLFFLLMCVPLGLFIGALSENDDPLLWGSLVASSIIFISIFTRSYGSRRFYMLLILLSAVSIFITSGIYIGKSGIDKTSKNLVISGIVFTGIILLFYYLMSENLGFERPLSWYINRDFDGIDYYNRMKKMKEDTNFKTFLTANPMAKNKFDSLFKQLSLEIKCLEKNDKDYYSLDLATTNKPNYKDKAKDYIAHQKTLSDIEEYIFGDSCLDTSPLNRGNYNKKIPTGWMNAIRGPAIFTQRMLFKRYLLSLIPQKPGKKDKQGRVGASSEDTGVLRVIKNA